MSIFANSEEARPKSYARHKLTSKTTANIQFNTDSRDTEMATKTSTKFKSLQPYPNPMHLISTTNRTHHSPKSMTIPSNSTTLLTSRFQSNFRRFNLTAYRKYTLRSLDTKSETRVSPKIPRISGIFSAERSVGPIRMQKRSAHQFDDRTAGRS